MASKELLVLRVTAVVAVSTLVSTVCGTATRSAVAGVFTPISAAVWMELPALPALMLVLAAAVAIPREGADIPRSSALFTVDVV